MAAYATTMIDVTHPMADIFGRRKSSATKRVQVYEHKLVLFNAIGIGPHPCHWCGRELHWEKGTKGAALIADHLDSNPANNDPANLVASCNGCNTIRARTRFRPAISNDELFVVNKDGTRNRADWCFCLECGSQFLAAISRIKRGTVKTCSRSCSTKIGLRNRWADKSSHGSR